MALLCTSEYCYAYSPPFSLVCRMSDEPPQEQSSASEEATYPFLNHSPTTLNHHLPPDVDNKPLARQRRKRTSPEDQAILEAAYQRDPKPDKDARLKLVERIALGEKEVQIWFQNRRQTSRRKSRPLLPHEIAQFQMSRYGAVSSDPMSDGHSESSINGHNSSNANSMSSNGSDAVDEPNVGKALSPSAVVADEDETGQLSSSVESSKPPVRSMPTLQQILDAPSNSNPSDDTLSFTGRPFKKSASFVRISMNSAGNARVITKDGLSPSPPRPAPATQQLTTSQVDPPSSSLKRSVSGRSRDSRAWEFWCDKECRAELEEKAERDGKGSAADAIGVIRATTSRKALQPIPSKHNTSSTKPQLWHIRRQGLDVKRPALQRAHTSGGRLQHAGGTGTAAEVKRVRLSKPTVLDTESSTYIPGNESDKENWSPGAEHGISGLPKDCTTSVPSKRHDRGQKASKVRSHDAENEDPEADDEVASFMRNNRSSGSFSGAEELDCVQGLLSLSQGRWAV